MPVILTGLNELGLKIGKFLFHYVDFTFCSKQLLKPHLHQDSSKITSDFPTATAQLETQKSKPNLQDWLKTLMMSCPATSSTCSFHTSRDALLQLCTT